MDINHHIAFRVEDKPLTYVYAVLNGILTKSVDPKSICSFDILESDPRWSHISALVKAEDVYCYSDIVFTKEEIQEAPWLTIRAMWEFGYPQPESKEGYMGVAYSSIYCRECSGGYTQTDPFHVKKAPKWGRRSIAMLYWVGDELFVNDRVKQAFQKEGLTGIEFWPVKNKSGSETLEGVHQLMFTTMLEKGVVMNQGIRETSVCPLCGLEKYLPSSRNMLSYRKEVFENAPDFVKSSEIFGSGHYSAHKLFVNQRVYQVLKKHSLLQGLVFEPVDLV